MDNFDRSDEDPILSSEFLLPMEAFVTYVKDRDWVYTCPNDTSCHFDIPGDTVSHHATLKWVPAFREVVMTISYDVACPQIYVARLSVTLNRVNKKITGKFFFEEENDLLMWEYTLWLAGVPGITLEQVGVIVDEGWHEFEKHLKELVEATGNELSNSKTEPESEARTLTHLPPLGRPN